ncbi:MAG: hypothetical protein IJC04_01795 [Oscillospiraceae bacterium]|nr:hypothetical protein [Oscillospiraceae bacterium]
MTMDIYREDDLLSYFGSYISKHGFVILALSGNQQGQYWFNLGDYRKAPDVIAVRDDVILVGEAKLKSRELFKDINGRPSDYQCLQYLIDNHCAKEQLSKKIIASLSQLGKIIEVLPPIQALVVGGDSFDVLKNKMIDERIMCFTVDKITGNVVLNKFDD